jgi:hypothetical protein
LKAILKWECDASIFPLLRRWIIGPQNGSLDELWTPDDPLDLENTTWTAIVARQAIFEAIIKNGKEHLRLAASKPGFRTFCRCWENEILHSEHQ